MRPTAIACFLAAVLSNFIATINLLNVSDGVTEADPSGFVIGAFLVPSALSAAGVLMWRRRNYA
jgi:hypothetical protein